MNVEVMRNYEKQLKILLKMLRDYDQFLRKILKNLRNFGNDFNKFWKIERNLRKYRGLNLIEFEWIVCSCHSVNNRRLLTLLTPRSGKVDIEEFCVNCGQFSKYSKMIW